LRKLAGLLGNKNFIAGELTWFDFTLADLLQTLVLLDGELLKGFPKLEEYYLRVWGLPSLKEYFGSERFRERPCNNYTAAWK
jgi:glutathione S-transferase